MNKAITFFFKDKRQTPTTNGMKLAIYKIVDGTNIYFEYGFSEWDGAEFGLPLLPYPDMTIELIAWADTVDPFHERPRIIQPNKN